MKNYHIYKIDLEKIFKFGIFFYLHSIKRKMLLKI